MTHTATTQHTATQLQYVIDSWPHLTDMLTTRHGTTWPPAGRMADQLRAEQQADMLMLTTEEVTARRAEHRLTERADSRYTLGESPAPIRLGILDVMRAVETSLVHCADILATEIQRPAMAKAPAHWPDEDRERRDNLAAQDTADPRRWRYPGSRSAVYAAGWLRARAEGRPGPFLPLAPRHRQRIAETARGAATRVAQALNARRHAELLDRDCPMCGGPLAMASGDGEAPVVACFGCRQEWTLPVSGAAA